jgi:hypothetical protein
VRWCECESCPQATRGRARAPPAWRRALHRIPSHPPASIPSHSSSAPSHPLPSRSEARTTRSAARTAGRAWLTRRRKKGLQGAQIDLQSGESNSRARESSFGRANRAQADGRVAELEVQGRSRPWRQRWRSSRFGPAEPPLMRDVGKLDLRSVTRCRGSDGRSSAGGRAQGAAAAVVVPRLRGFSMASAMGGVAAPVGGTCGERPTTGWGLPSPPVGRGAGGGE